MNFDNEEYSKLNYIREIIENMNKSNHVEILKLLMNHKDIVVNSNKSGIRINLSDLSPKVIDELMTYVNYIQNQEQQLSEIEKQKEDYKNTYFQKENV